MKAINPYLNFNGNTEEAFEFYRSIFGGELEILRYEDFENNSMAVPEADLKKIAHAALSLDEGTVLMGTDTLASIGQTLTIGNNFYIMIEPDSVEETQELFAKLSAGGKVEMPLAESEWAEIYGMTADKFGVQWMLNYTGNKV